MNLIKKTAFFSLLASLMLTCGFTEVFTINFCWDEAPFYEDGKYKFNGNYITFDSCNQQVDSGTFSAVSEPKHGNDFCDQECFNADTEFSLFHNLIEKILSVELKRNEHGCFRTEYEHGREMYECWEKSHDVQLGISCGGSQTCYTVVADVQMEC